MAEQVKPDIHVSQAMDSSLSKGSGKPRGSGSPFRCIGLGIAQQMRSEKDEELAAARLRIEELETVVATRQKEVTSRKCYIYAVFWNPYGLYFKSRICSPRYFY